MKLNKKTLTVLIIALVAVAGIAVTVYIIQHDKKRVENPGAYYGKDADGFSASVDPDKHLGTINVVDVSQLEKAFGDSVTIGDPKESGVVSLGTTKSETVSYTVKAEKGDAKFEVDARTYATKADLEKAMPFAGTEKPVVADVGEEAHYLVPFGQDVMKEQQVALIVVKGKTSYKFGLVQQSDALIYDLAESKRLTLDVAKQASLDEIK